MAIRYNIGIDLGKGGAIVVIDNKTNEIEKVIMPLIKGTKELDVAEIINILKIFDPKESFVSFEDVRAIFGAMAGATFTFGFVAGATEAAVISLGFQFRKVNPKVWQKLAFAGVPEIRKPDTKDKNGKVIKGRVDTKAMALLASKRLFPDFDGRATERSRNAHDGIIDALLIAWYITQTYK